MYNKKKIASIIVAASVLILNLIFFANPCFAKNEKNFKKNSRYIYPLVFFKHRPVKFIEQLTQNEKRWPIALKSLAKAGFFLRKKHIKYSIIIAAYGPGLKAFVMKYNKKYAGVVETLHKEGIKIVVCGESMKEAGITPKMLFPFVRITYPGILSYIVEKEDQGYAFLKP